MGFARFPFISLPAFVRQLVFGPAESVVADFAVVEFVVQSKVVVVRSLEYVV